MQLGDYRKVVKVGRSLVDTPGDGRRCLPRFVKHGELQESRHPLCCHSFTSTFVHLPLFTYFEGAIYLPGQHRTMSPSFSKRAIGGAALILASAQAATADFFTPGLLPRTVQACSSPQLSCQNTTVQADLCCFNAPGGQLLLTQFWDTNPVTGPVDSWTVHGLW